MLTHSTRVPALPTLARTFGISTTALALSLGVGLSTGLGAAYAAPTAPATHPTTSAKHLVEIKPGDTIVTASGAECTVTDKFNKPAPNHVDDYAAYGVSFWGVLTGNCGSVSAFWTRQTSDEIIEATENTPLASVVAKVLPPKSTSMKEIGEAAYLKGAKNKGVVGWTTSTGVGISFLGVNPATATYVGPAQPE